MRPVTPAALLALVLVAGCGESTSQATRPVTREALARLAFDALQANDFERLRPSLPSAADSLWMLETLSQDAPTDKVERLRQELAQVGGAEAIAERATGRVRASFTEARTEAAERLTWTEAQFGGLLAARSAITTRDGLETADIVFAAVQGERRELLMLSHCVRTADGWIITHRVVLDPAPHGGVPTAGARFAMLRLDELNMAIQLYYLHHRLIPADLDSLMEPDERTGEAYLRPGFADPWGNAPLIRPLDGRKYLLLSAGPDGAFDTEDDIVWPEHEEEPDAE